MTEKTSQHPIVVPVDFSDYSEEALVYATQIAGCHKSKVIVLHVVHDPAEMPGYYTKKKKKVLGRMQDAAAEMLKEFLDKVHKDHPEIKGLKKVETMMVMGLPVTRILQVVEKTNAGLVVMGSQGRTGLKHILLGSKAEQIVHLCPVPVTIVKAKQSK